MLTCNIQPHIDICFLASRLPAPTLTLEQQLVCKEKSDALDLEIKNFVLALQNQEKKTARLELLLWILPSGAVITIPTMPQKMGKTKSDDLPEKDAKQQ
jgi:hypothetical protein